jgi:hypothetical protein
MWEPHSVRRPLGSNAVAAQGTAVPRAAPILESSWDEPHSWTPSSLWTRDRKLQKVEKHKPLLFYPDQGSSGKSLLQEIAGDRELWLRQALERLQAKSCWGMCLTGRYMPLGRLGARVGDNMISTLVGNHLCPTHKRFYPFRVNENFPHLAHLQFPPRASPSSYRVGCQL